MAIKIHSFQQKKSKVCMSHTCLICLFESSIVTFLLLSDIEGAWWQVELDAVDVRKIKIFQRDCCKFASNARVLLLDQQYRVFGMYRIGNVTNVPSFEININDFQPPIRGVRSVYIEHDQRAEYMTLSEVEVYDASNVNVAKSMVASQSSTGAYPANLGNDGDKNTFFSTEKEKRKCNKTFVY